MFIHNPDPFLLPSYRISPFKTDFISINTNLPNEEYCISYLNEKFGEGNWQFTYNGREGIKLALESYNLKSTDLVTILTTSQNFYISSCVTKTIELFCTWNREILPQTTVIFVNHEFGYPYPDMEQLVATGIPIIEDCCTTFFSQDKSRKVGSYGDFSVYSLPKYFPIQIGGILTNNVKNKPLKKSILTIAEKEYIQKVLSYHLKTEKVLLQKRKTIYEYALETLLPLGFTLRFATQKGIIPYALLLNNNSTIKDLPLLKTYLTNNGIQCSVFYGEDAFFLPIHQNLTCLDIDYFKHIIISYH